VYVASMRGRSLRIRFVCRLCLQKKKMLQSLCVCVSLAVAVAVVSVSVLMLPVFPRIIVYLFKGGRVCVCACVM
jgi:hypothetical protein